MELLPCGCIKGVRLCPEGQRLDAEKVRIWRELRDIPTDDHRWAPYDAAVEKLDLHLGNQPVGCTR